MHLVWDEKILHRIVKTFDSVFPNNNIYIYWEFENAKLKFIQNITSNGLICNVNNISEIDFSKISKVIIHGLDQAKIDFVRKNIPITVPVYWLLWGFEIYNSFLFQRGFKVYYSSKPHISVKEKIKLLIKRLGFLSKQDKKFLSFFSEYDVTMICAKEEYNIFRKYYPKETKFLKSESDYFYYPIDEVLGTDLIKKYITGNNIMIGNSASWTNNHEYVFKYLKNLNIDGRDIIVPISYGGNEEYKNLIKSEGEKIFGYNFNHITDFLPLNEYNNLILTSNVFLYGNWRQEAVGNIVIALYLGGKVFLSRHNPILKIFSNMGLKLFVLEEICQKSLDEPLSPTDIENNRSILMKRQNWERLKQITYNIFK